ncbi:hypothetical protein [Tissierella sp.]|uniref:hypothetical protein n=1 Tax=Tissierella sp. TaxID=41274 RepID=UPI0028562DCF|nr:hypothetical protein [Tissierella sp.]MDR7856055.1 hypothetical protein [Tissierella sp.]
MNNGFNNDDFKEVIAKFNETMNGFYKNINENIVESIKPLLELSKIEIPNTIFLNNISDMLKEFGRKISEGLKDTIESIEDYKQLCLLLGYPPHEDISIPDIKGIVDLYNELNGDMDKIKPIIDEFYISTFDVQAIREIFIAKWSDSDLLDKRIELIEESISCFEQGLYFSAIPILFSQLEGMVADANNHCGQMGGKKLGNYISEIFNNENKYSFDNELLKFYGNVLFVPFEHGKELESFLSRHAIMHGGDVEYGTQANYIKLILFFDSVYEGLIKNQEDNDSETEN